MMRRAALVVIFCLAVAPAMAQQDGSGSGVGPGQSPPQAPNREAPPVPQAPQAPQGCADPSFGGKYSSELRRLNVPADLSRYGRCRDYGPWAGNAYAGFTNLPNGFWVYSYPYWIIYANRRAAQ